MQRYRLEVGSDSPDEPGIPAKMRMASEGCCGPDRARGYEALHFDNNDQS